MKKLFIFVFAIIFPVFLAQAETEQIQEPEQISDNYKKAEMKEILVEEGDLIPVILKESLNSANIQEGQKVKGEVAEDIVIDERIIVKKGTPVKGYIEASNKAGSGRSGNIGIRFTSTTSVDGKKVSLKSAANRNGSVRTANVFVGPFAVGAPIGQGSNASFAKGARISAFVDEEIQVQSDLLGENKTKKTKAKRK